MAPILPGEAVSRYDHSNAETLHLEPMPCWKGLSRDERQARAADLIHEIERETRAKHREAGTTPMGVKHILRQHPHTAPAKVAKSPAPRFHASCYDAWRCLLRLPGATLPLIQRASRRRRPSAPL